MKADLIPFLELFNYNKIHYSVPRWQRRYSWEKPTILELIKDLVAISKRGDDNSNHFGGTLITYPVDSPPGHPPIELVVDGQQRLTTISILLSCIADKLDEDETQKQWTSSEIRFYLTNQFGPQKLKLKLQDEDDLEYRQIIEGHHPHGNGKIIEAWNILRSEVASKGPETLIKGLERFQVIGFKCGKFDDPQQIFESLNATGHPLTEGEKVKNWLLMGLDPKLQKVMYQDYWCKLENCLGALSEPKRIDTFLRDFLRWQTGENVGIKYTYANLKRWWDRPNNENQDDKTQLCKELARSAALYGKISGTNGRHPIKEIDHVFRHLRALQLDTHRPFTLRLLDDATKSDLTGAHQSEVIKVLESISIWLTRIWLADAPTPGLNTEMTNFAHRRNTKYIDSYADYWTAEIRKLRNTRIAVPNEEEIENGIRSRKAYGAKASSAAKTVLYEMNLLLGGDTPPRMEDLSLEHIMPQKLSDEWKKYLKNDVNDLHGEYKNMLANLTLVGKDYNPKIGNSLYKLKREYYQDSNVMLTRKLAKSYLDWKADEMELRSLEITELALECWPWENITRAKVRWSTDNEDWKEEKTYASMLLNVVRRLLDLNPEKNSQELLGDRIRKDIFYRGTEPKDSGRFRSIPQHNDYVVNLNFSSNDIVKLCSEMGRRCGVMITIDSFSDREKNEWRREVHTPTNQRNSKIHWRIGSSDWKKENTYRSLMLNVTAALLDIDPDRNSRHLLGNRATKDLFLSGSEPRSSGVCFKQIPRFEQYVINVNHAANSIVRLCKEMGDRCEVGIYIEQ